MGDATHLRGGRVHPKPRSEWLRDIDELWEVAGSGPELADMLGLAIRTVYNWRNYGVSPIGALLVSKSETLGRLFAADDLHPGLDLKFFGQHKRYREARERQEAYEADPRNRTHLEKIRGIVERRGKCKIELHPRS